MKKSGLLLMALLPMAASCSSNGLTRVPYRIEIVQNEDYSFSIYQPFDLSEVPAYIGKEGGKRTDYILPGETANAYFDAGGKLHHVVVEPLSVGKGFFSPVPCSDIPEFVFPEDIFLPVNETQAEGKVFDETFTPHWPDDGEEAYAVYYVLSGRQSGRPDLRMITCFLSFDPGR